MPVATNTWKDQLQQRISRSQAETAQSVNDLIATGASTRTIAGVIQEGKLNVNNMLEDYNSAQNIASRQRVVAANPKESWASDAAGLATLNTHGAVSGTTADASTQVTNRVNPYASAIYSNSSAAGVDAGSNTVSRAPKVNSLISAPPKAINVEDIPDSINSGTKGTQIHPNIYKPPGVTTYETGKRPKATGWLEEYIDPTMFASGDACIITIGASKKEKNEDGSLGKILGFCNNASFNISNAVITIKELRAERTIIIPGKAQPGQLSLSRLVCKGDTVTNFLGIVSKESDRKLRFDNQLRISKKPFGIGIVLLSSIGQKELSTVYIEECAISNISVPIAANTYALYENVGITFNRIRDI